MLIMFCFCLYLLCQFIPTLIRFQFLPTVIGVFDDSSDYPDVSRALRKRGRFRSSVDFNFLLNIRNV